MMIGIVVAVKKKGIVIDRRGCFYISDSLVDDADGLFEVDDIHRVHIPDYIVNSKTIRDITKQKSFATDSLIDHHGVIGRVQVLTVAQYYEIKRIIDLVSPSVVSQLNEVGISLIASGVKNA